MIGASLLTRVYYTDPQEVPHDFLEAHTDPQEAPTGQREAPTDAPEIATDPLIPDTCFY